MAAINGCMEEKRVWCVLGACRTVLGYFLVMSKLVETLSTLRDLERNKTVRAAVCQHLVFGRFCAVSVNQ